MSSILIMYLGIYSRNDAGSGIMKSGTPKDVAPESKETSHSAMFHGL